MSIRDQVSLYNQSQFDSYLGGKNAQRRKLMAASRRGAWRNK
jgi:hypothetical protein